MVIDYSAYRITHAIALIRLCLMAQVTLWNTQREIEQLFETDFDNMSEALTSAAHNMDEPIDALTVSNADVAEILQDWITEAGGDVSLIFNGWDGHESEKTDASAGDTPGH